MQNLLVGLLAEAGFVSLERTHFSTGLILLSNVDDSIPFSFINYAAHCAAWLSYGKRLWPKQLAARGWIRKH